MLNRTRLGNLVLARAYRRTDIIKIAVTYLSIVHLALNAGWHYTKNLLIIYFADLTVLRLVVFLLGKFGISVVFTSLYLFTSELYPTQYRHSLLAFSSMVGRIGSITAPLTPVLVSYQFQWGSQSHYTRCTAITRNKCIVHRLQSTNCTNCTPQCKTSFIKTHRQHTQFRALTFILK